jgi:hypothetical protein
MPPGSALAGLSSTYSGMWIVDPQDAEARGAWQAFHYAANNLAFVLAYLALASSNAKQNNDPSTSLQKVPEYVGNSDAPPISNSFDSKPGHRCVWFGCNKTFSHSADSNRHFLAKHGEPIKYFYRVAGCNRARGIWKGYCREDKLMEHMKKRHTGIEAIQ